MREELRWLHLIVKESGMEGKHTFSKHLVWSEFDKDIALVKLPHEQSDCI